VRGLGEAEHGRKGYRRRETDSDPILDCAALERFFAERFGDALLLVGVGSRARRIAAALAALAVVESPP
jgi:hypothetical protein